MAKVADRYLTTDAWKLVEEGFSAARSKVSESVFSLSNEHFGVRGFFEEGYTGESLVGCYLNGVYEEHHLREPMHYKGIANRICFMVNTVNWLYTRIELDGEVLDLHRSEFSDFRRVLDFKTGELTREFVWNTKSGRRLRVSFRRLLSMETKELGLQRIALTALDFSGPVSLTLGSDFSVRHEMYSKSFWNCPRHQNDRTMSALLGVSHNIRHKLFAGFCVLSPDRADEQLIEDERFVGRRLTLNLALGRESAVERVSILYTTRDPAATEAETYEAGLGLLEHAARGNYASELANNARYWQAFWERSDIEIDGDEDTQQGIRFCIFQLQQTYRGVVEGANIGAKGLTGEVYNGNAFWDTETYCLPYYLLNTPEAARSLIEFRYKTLPQALERAIELDCKGACFPIATIDGTESCTLWQHASLQFQPTTGVAYAIDHYVKVTGDTDFLHTTGIELLLHICRFLASRGQWSERRKKFGYWGVMGPDEFQVMVNNNCYTNYLAQRTFRSTLAALEAMESSAPQRRTAVLATLDVEPSELAAWRSMADDMIIPRDPETGVFEQHEGFFDLPHVDVDAIPVTDFPLYANWSYDRIYRNDMIKQPDVLMFMFLYNQSFSLDDKRKNYEYYEPRTIHESSLSPSLHSILAAELGRDDEAFEFFRFASRIDLDNYNRNTSEGIHTTSIAAAWMNVVYGYGGLRSDGPEIALNPTIPSRWKSYCFRISVRGSVVRVRVTQESATLELVEGPPLTLRVAGVPRVIERSAAVVPLRKSAA